MSSQGAVRSELVALAGILLAGAYVLRVLTLSGFDPTILLALGEESPTQTAYARDLLGAVTVRAELGHDGKYFFAQANDPLFLEPQTHAVVLDRPIYRGQRMLYPLVAGGFGLFPPEVVVWSLIAVNLLAFGVGTYATARVAQALGASPLLGLFFALNIGLLAEADIDGAGVVAFALGVVGIWMAYESRTVAAAVALTGAALAREVMIGLALGLAFGIWFNRRQLKPLLVLMPMMAVAVWNVYLRLRVEGLLTQGDSREIAPFPFAGLIDAIPSWFEDGTSSLVIGFAVVLLIIVFTIRALLDRSILAWAGLPFAGLAALLSIYVWFEPMDIARGIAPIFTLYPLLLFRPTGQSTVSG